MFASLISEVLNKKKYKVAFIKQKEKLFANNNIDFEKYINNWQSVEEIGGEGWNDFLNALKTPIYS